MTHGAGARGDVPRTSEGQGGAREAGAADDGGPQRPRRRPVAHSETVMTQLMVPQWVNLHGTVHGGYVLMLADQIAYVVACRHAGRPTVTASIDEVDFRSPIHVGDVVTLRARVNYAGRTSMEIGVRIEAEDLLTGEVRHTNSCYITMVAVDESGRPVPVPGLELRTPEERSRHARANERRAVRENRRLRRSADPAGPAPDPGAGGRPTTGA